MPDVALFVFTVYRRPGYYAVRPYRIDGPDTPGGTKVVDMCHEGRAGTLQAVRKLMPPEADARLPRHRTDAPDIVESWPAVLPADAYGGGIPRVCPPPPGHGG